MSQQHPVAARAALPLVAALLCTAAIAFAPATYAASAAVHTRIIQAPLDRSSGDSSSGRLVFATDSLTNVPQTVSVNASSGNSSLSTFASAFAGPFRAGNNSERVIGLATAS